MEKQKLLFSPLWWDLLLLFTITYSTIEIPLWITFTFKLTDLLLVLSCLISLVFTIDIIKNVVHYKNLDKKKKDSSQDHLTDYFRSWFFFDLIASIPFDILVSFSVLPNFFQYLSLLRIVRIIRLVNLSTLLQKGGINGFLNPIYIKLLYMVYWLVITFHFAACGWVLISEQEKAGAVTDYIRSFYWVVMTFTTIGYGDIVPKTNRETIYAIVIMILGAGMYGYIIGNIANLIATIDIAKAQYTEKMERIQTFMQYKKIPPDIQHKVIEYYNYIWENRRGYDEAIIMNDLPDGLKAKVTYELNKDTLNKIPMFKDAEKGMIDEIMLNLKPVIFTPGDYVFKKGDDANEMYFVSRGFLNVLNEQDQVLATLREGNFFGELALIKDAPRAATIQAVEYCDMYSLNKDTFSKIISRYEKFRKAIHEAEWLQKK